VKPRVLILAALGAALAVSGLVFDVPDRLVWNRTASAPIGLYWLSHRSPTRGDWVVVSRRSAPARWAQTHGFVGPDWPLLKQVSALPGDEICREDAQISINGHPAADALTRAASGVRMPVWTGCVTLGADEIFLLNAHPRSLDGRYFAATPQADVDGVAVHILAFGDR
jgi:conjugative transfer signal peptidase TraF